MPRRLEPIFETGKPDTSKALLSANALKKATTKKVAKMMEKRAAYSVLTSYESRFSPFRMRPYVETKTLQRDVLNSWFRYYYEHDPYIGTAIDLHSEFPLSSFELTHEDDVLYRDFNDIKESLDLETLLVQMAKEYFCIGECFPFGFFDDPNDPGCWDSFILLDPGKIELQAHSFIKGGKWYNIKLRPDDTLKKIIGNGPYDKETGDLYQKMPSDILDYVRADEAIPLNSVQVSHFKRVTNPFALRGTSLILRVLPILMYRDKIRDAQFAIAERHLCYDEQTECLTKDGWKWYYEVTEDDEIGTVNKDTGALEYQKPEFVYVSAYKGKMYHFSGNKLDIMVTPDHRMLVQRYKYAGQDYTRRKYGNVYEYDGTWEVVTSQEVRHCDKFRGVIDKYDGDIPPETVKIGEQEIPIRKYLQFLGWWLSEGTLYKCKVGQAEVSVSQSVKSKHHPELQNFFDNFELGFKEYQEGRDGYAKCAIFHINNDALAEHLETTCGTRSHNKHIPAWIRNLPPDLLQILVDAMMSGDGHEATTSEWKGKQYSRSYKQYYTTSKELANNVQEVVFKMGHAPTLSRRSIKGETKDGRPYYDLYTVQWSETSKFGRFPVMGKCFYNKDRVQDYDGIIWCVHVPNSFFVTRRNGKITVQGNTPKEVWKIGTEDNPADEDEIEAFRNLLAATWSDPNLAIVWHHALSTDIHGPNDKLLNVKGEMDHIKDEMFAGLMLNEAFLRGSGPTYANASVALDVLISRYLVFRLGIEQWMIRHAFAPLCRIHKIYKPTQAEVEHRIRIKKKAAQPWTPDVQWSKANLRDDQMKISLYERLVDKALIPKSELLHLVNLNPDEMQDKVKKEQEEGVGAPGGLPTGLPGAMPGPPPSLPAAMPPVAAPEEGAGIMPPESERPVGLPGGEAI